MATPAELLSESECVVCTGGSTLFQTMAIAILKRWTTNLGEPFTQDDLEEASACFVCQGFSLPDANIVVLLNRVLEILTFGVSPVASFVQRSGITDQTQIDALTSLVESAMENGWWDKCDCIYPFVGGTAQAHSQNLKADAFNITWVGTVTHDANGIMGNGTTGYGDTGYIPASSGQWSLNSAHIGAYIRVMGTGGNATVVGSTTVVGDFTRFGRGASAVARSVGINETSSASIAASALAWNMGVRLDAAAKHLYAGVVDTSSATVSIGLSTSPFFVLALNNAGVAQNFSVASIAGITVGSGITFAEYELMRADWQTFNTTLGRQV